MPMKRYKPEQIVNLLRQIEVEIAKGKTTPQAYALNSILAHRPACFTQLHSDPPVAVAPVFTGQGNDRSGQLILVDPLDRGIALCPSPLPQQPTGMPLAHFVLFARMLHRTTPPLRA